MKDDRIEIQDKRMENFIGMLLRVGVLTAAAIALAGGIWHLAVRGKEVVSYSTFNGEPANLRDIPQIVSSAFSLHSDSVIQLGILVLIFVPILRVAVSIVAFAGERDWVYVIVTSAVLAVLLFSLLSGFA